MADADEVVAIPAGSAEAVCECVPAKVEFEDVIRKAQLAEGKPNEVHEPSGVL